jgi:heme-degrading monooxygenase HmoA
MYVVLFEVRPKSEKWDDYLGLAKLLKPELEAIPGFLANVRYRSLTRDGWLLSLSTWQNEKALVRWRTQAVHHGAQEKGRFEIFGDYHLRVGEAVDKWTVESADETEVGLGTSVTYVEATRPADWIKSASPEEIATALGLRIDAPGLVAWDVFEAILTPGDLLLLMTSRDRISAHTAEHNLPAGETVLHRVRIVRDYGMFDRREAPQFYPR